MVDIHTHILPGVDDGSQNFDESLKMLKQAKKNNITDIILTPHMIYNSESFKSKEIIIEHFNKFKEETKDIGINLYLGSEIYYTESAEKALFNSELLNLNNSKYCLIEFSMSKEIDIDEIMYNIRVKGYKPILAHPERYKYLTPAKVADIKENCLIQINTSSILGYHGKHIKKFALQLLKLKLVDFIASDSHNSEIRCPNLLETRKIVEKKFGKEYAELLFNTNANKILE